MRAVETFSPRPQRKGKNTGAEGGGPKPQKKWREETKVTGGGGKKGTDKGPA